MAHTAPTSIRDADELERDGLVSVSRQGTWKDYRATAAGLARAGELERLNPEGASGAKRFVVWALQTGFVALLQAVYRAYPDMAVNSVFRHPS